MEKQKSDQWKIKFEGRVPSNINKSYILPFNLELPRKTWLLRTTHSQHSDGTFHCSKLFAECVCSPVIAIFYK